MSVPAKWHRVRLVIASALAALLWFGSGLLSFLLLGTKLSQPAELVLPVSVLRMAWVWPDIWGTVGVVIATITLAVLSWALLTLVALRSRLSFLAAWMIVVLAATAVGIAVSIGRLVASIPLLGFFAFSLDPAQYPLAGAYWGVLYGWIPALIAANRLRDTNTQDGAHSFQLKPGESRHRTNRWWPVGFVGVAILAIAALITVTALEARAQRVAAQQSVFEDGPEMPDGVVVDPYAAGEPPPESIPAEETRKPEWCTPEQAMLLLGTPDAATGHRVQPIRLMNFSEEECVVEGYPDIAFADQNGNLLEVVLTRGSSFMVDDPGRVPVVLPPGGFAVTYLGWNANPTHNQLVVSAIHAAQVAGDPRGSWSGQPGLDIIEGSEVFVTAWALDESSSAAD